MIHIRYDIKSKITNRNRDCVKTVLSDLGASILSFSEIRPDLSMLLTIDKLESVDLPFYLTIV